MNNLWSYSDPLTLEGQAVLLAMEPSALNELVIPQLEEARMNIRIAASLEDAVQKLTFATPDFLILCEGFSTRQSHLNPLLAYVAKMPAALRHNLIVVWISNQVKTRDYLTAYSLSVNVVVQPEYLQDLARIMKETWQETLDLFEGYVQLQQHQHG